MTRLTIALLAAAAVATGACSGPSVEIRADGQSATLTHASYGVVLDYGTHDEQLGGIPPRARLDVFLHEGDGCRSAIDLAKEDSLELVYVLPEEGRREEQALVRLGGATYYGNGPIEIDEADIENLPDGSSGEWAPFPAVSGTFAGSLALSLTTPSGSAAFGEAEGDFEAEHCVELDESVTE